MNKKANVFLFDYHYSSIVIYSIDSKLKKSCFFYIKSKRPLFKATGQENQLNSIIEKSFYFFTFIRHLFFSFFFLSFFFKFSETVNSLLFKHLVHWKVFFFEHIDSTLDVWKLV